MKKWCSAYETGIHASQRRLFQPRYRGVHPLDTRQVGGRVGKEQARDNDNKSIQGVATSFRRRHKSIHQGLRW